MQRLVDERDTLQDASRDASEAWGRRTSIILIALATMAISLVRAAQLPVVSNGLLLGGVHDDLRLAVTDPMRHVGDGFTVVNVGPVVLMKETTGAARDGEDAAAMKGMTMGPRIDDSSIPSHLQSRDPRLLEG